MAQRKRRTKTCVGCSAPFLTYANYDYCKHCSLNNSRYVSRSNQCPECGDGSGKVKFPGQPRRKCKLCSLSKLTAEKQEEKFWDEVDQLAQEKIYQLLTTNIPFQNIKLITEPWKFEDRQQKLSGLFLDRDVDYRTLLGDIQEQSSPETSDKEYLAEEIAVWYCRAVIKALINDLSDYASYDPSLFSNLTTNEY